jgi:hypothetical protein
MLHFGRNCPPLVKRDQRADGAKRKRQDLALLQCIEVEWTQSNADLSSTMTHQIETRLCDSSARGINLVGVTALHHWRCAFPKADAAKCPQCYIDPSHFLPRRARTACPHRPLPQCGRLSRLSSWSNGHWCRMQEAVQHNERRRQRRRCAEPTNRLAPVGPRWRPLRREHASPGSFASSKPTGTVSSEHRHGERRRRRRRRVRPNKRTSSVTSPSRSARSITR